MMPVIRQPILAPVLSAYASLRPDDAIYAYVSDKSMQAAVRRKLPFVLANQVHFVELTIPGFIGFIARILDALMPASRVTRLTFERQQIQASQCARGAGAHLSFPQKEVRH